MVEVKVPELAESITEGTIVKWLKEEGDFVKQGDILLELETDKVNLEINAEHDGILRKHLKQEGDAVTVGEVIALLDEEATGEHRTADKSPGETQDEERDKDGNMEADDWDSTLGKEQLATPAARRRARQQGIDLGQVESLDPWGRIHAADIEKHKGAPGRAVNGEKGEREQKQVHPEQAKALEQKMYESKPVERIRMSRRRQTIARRLVEAQHTAAMLTTFNEVDMTAIMELRKRHKEAFYQEHGVRLGYMSFFTKAVIGALKKFPLLNAEIQGDEIVVKKYYDIGVAVATDQGLVVPVVRNADKLSFAEIEREIASLAEKARQNKLSVSDLQGGTFTITNGGVFGSLLSTPILNPPQVGILGMHKIQIRPVAVDEERMENRPMMYIALSYDHRIVDGKEAVSFLVKVKELLEDPETLLLEG
ncbi:dihydrolipoyllysine-residue succinyltransferase component of 2-oxoglutarate dehydrogenase complex [Caldalkalibacillus thermarum]|uniref:2-oxoglutarate dehydrogenase complex dihydrolipoyllysine-residue succinyltransferase n=1 Tax=Caldalkalibacillus thermarum TaxID=296745 RepID=UPI001665E43F|nr:2-oxoglutarate dehydrogenase complex dihydrolipoyllysine-residue succinyltransferase [Caldalkalibacillus thermarum]GGK16754.1 dihydrolipoyllysine-residue succinyltransferase component of 2-oxoglutarate dehydrogenase complex [Caldalkalibacillus thermarum]GGK26327.1 dihydrolipoyllysine-residue succinyltransferase component of 2-oxoglutarate dehydrogenase complex [Caldalkalibacillus thermarum]